MTIQFLFFFSSDIYSALILIFRLWIRRAYCFAYSSMSRMRATYTRISLAIDVTHTAYATDSDDLRSWRDDVS